MNAKKLWMLALVMMIAAAPAFAGEATQMWRCEMTDEADEEMIEAHSGEWLAAAKKVEGGADIKAKILFPVAVNATGQMDVMYVVTCLRSRSGASSGMRTPVRMQRTSKRMVTSSSSARTVFCGNRSR